MLSRRSVIRASLALPTALWARRLGASDLPFERKFLFFYADGGWDTTAAFDPHFGSDFVDMEEDTELATVGGISFTGGAARPGLTRFLERWGERTCFVNGLDSHSVGHGSAREFVLTGAGGASTPDWATILASTSRREYSMPFVVLSGPAFPGQRGEVVVRASASTLMALMDHSLVGSLDRSTGPLQPGTDRLVDAWLAERAASWSAARAGGLGGERARAFQDSLERARELDERALEVSFETNAMDTRTQARNAVELFRLDLARCAMISVDGFWDTHTDNQPQGQQLDAFFETLDEIVELLARTPGTVAPTLLGETTIVALSDFGRTPSENAASGKDHWPYGSALLVGSGVNGDRAVGLTDDSLIAQAIDLDTGAPDGAGDIPGVENLGAALLLLGGLDPQPWLPDVQPLAAVIR